MHWALVFLSPLESGATCLSAEVQSHWLGPLSDPPLELLLELLLEPLLSSELLLSLLLATGLAATTLAFALGRIVPELEAAARFLTGWRRPRGPRSPPLALGSALLAAAAGGSPASGCDGAAALSAAARAKPRSPPLGLPRLPPQPRPQPPLLPGAAGASSGAGAGAKGASAASKSSSLSGSAGATSTSIESRTMSAGISQSLNLCIAKCSRCRVHSLYFKHQYFNRRIVSYLASVGSARPRGIAKRFLHPNEGFFRWNGQTTCHALPSQYWSRDLPRGGA